jgi:putative peptidoglycan lipid II flippase
MLRKILSVGGFTLLSRVSGFGRDIMLAAILGASALMDAFVVAQKLPNQFRAIFGEGAFSSAFIPTYARLREQAGAAAAAVFANRVFSLVLIAQIVILAAALPAMPGLIALVAPGQRDDPAQFALTVALARIAFPYLLFITLVTLQAGCLNAVDRFAAAAFAPVLLNLSVMLALGVAFLFPSAAHAAAWGVAAAGVAEWLLLTMAGHRAGVLARPARPRLDADVKQFLSALGPAVIGSAGVQIAVLADMILASFLPTGSYAAIYYADRLYQLPLGVIGIAAGTVVLPTMSRLIAAGDPAGAAEEQNRAFAATLLVATPFLAAFLTMPDLLIAALFGRGAFDQAAVAAAAPVLLAYSFGLIPALLLRSTVASFFARGDTATPVKASLTALAINVALKFVLSGQLGAAGLALATSVGAWINFGLLYVLAMRRGWTTPDERLVKTAMAGFAGVIGFALVALTLKSTVIGWTALAPFERGLLAAMALGGLGLAVYLGCAAICAKLMKLDLRALLTRSRGQREHS